MKLDSKAVKNLKLPPGKDDHCEWDEDLSGFALRLRASGSMSWIVQYRHGGRTRRLKLGSVEKVNPDAARKQAEQLLAKAELGADPAGEKATARAKAANTLGSVVTDYLEFKKPTLRPASYKVTSIYLTGRYFKPLHNMPMTDIGLADVAARLKVIARESGATTARQARVALSAMWTWSMKEGLCGPQPFNPVAVTNAPAVGAPRERVLTDAELAAVWRESGDDHFGKITRLLMLTAARRQEIGSLKWSEIDFEKGTLTIPPERTKNHRALTLPLAPVAMDIIRGTMRTVGRDSVFGTRADGFMAWTDHKARLDVRLGAEVAEWNLHDIRRSVATGLANLGTLPHVIETILNHQSGFRSGVASVYNKSPYAKEVSEALTKWAGHLAEIVDRPRMRKIVGRKSA
jgi:integrase